MEDSNHCLVFVHVHVHALLIFLKYHDVIIFLGRKVAYVENNGLGSWLNAYPNGQSVIRIFRIAHS